MSTQQETNPQIRANLKVLALINKANETTQYPKIRLCNGYTLSLAGSRSIYPGSINITDGKPYGSNIWYGRIHTDGTIWYSRNITNVERGLIEYELYNFASDPAEYAQLYGKLTSNCMFCGRELTNQQSIAVGYGPICAGKYGLPHGDLSKQEAYDASHSQMELVGLDEEILDEQYIAKAITKAELIVELEAKLKELRG